MARSAKALSTHSRAITFIKNLTLRKDIFNKEIAHRQSLADRLGTSHNKIERKTGANRLSNVRRLHSRRPIVRHDYQQVYVGIFGGLAICVRTKKHYPFRMKLDSHFLNKILYVLCSDHCLVPKS